LGNAATNGQADIVGRLILADGVTDVDRNTALLLSAENGHVAVVEQLQNAPGITGENRATALWSAADNDHADVVEKLQHADGVTGADRGYALEIAAQNGHANVVEILRNANNVPSVHRANARNQASDQGHQHIASLLAGDEVRSIEAIDEQTASLKDGRTVSRVGNAIVGKKDDIDVSQCQPEMDIFTLEFFKDFSSFIVKLENGNCVSLDDLQCTIFSKTILQQHAGRGELFEIDS
jgi:hypothetical protein